ncbi:hypothetical protein Tco_1356907 [Tanacetum coccineum]
MFNEVRVGSISDDMFMRLSGIVEFWESDFPSEKVQIVGLGGTYGRAGAGLGTSPELIGPGVNRFVHLFLLGGYTNENSNSRPVVVVFKILD